MELITTRVDPSFLLRLSSLACSRSLWTWCSLVLATIATFGSLLRRLRLIVSHLPKRIHRPTPDIAVPTEFDPISDDDEDDEEDENEVGSATSSSCFEEEEEEEEEFVDTEEGSSPKGIPAVGIDAFQLCSRKDVVRTWTMGNYTIRAADDRVYASWEGDGGVQVWDERMGFRAPAVSWGGRRPAVDLWALRGEERVLFVVSDHRGATATKVDLRWGKNAAEEEVLLRAD